MVKMRKVVVRGGKKKVSAFYGKLVMFENLGLWLMLPAQEVYIPISKLIMISIAVISLVTSAFYFSEDKPFLGEGSVRTLAEILGV